MSGMLVSKPGGTKGCSLVHLKGWIEQPYGLVYALHMLLISACPRAPSVLSTARQYFNSFRYINSPQIQKRHTLNGNLLFVIKMNLYQLEQARNLKFKIKSVFF